jgi:hypothetical protein
MHARERSGTRAGDEPSGAQRSEQAHRELADNPIVSDVRWNRLVFHLNVALHLPFARVVILSEMSNAHGAKNLGQLYEPLRVRAVPVLV